MILRPKKGQRVCLHYASRARAVMPFHGREGVVETVAAHRGGPVNVAVRLDSGGTVVVPRGNLVLVREIMNLNDRIKFKLTERGKRLVKSKQLIVTENPEGYCIMSLHAFCPEFGPYFVPQLGENFIEANNIEKVSDALR